jgi:hypothetical protein
MINRLRFPGRMEIDDELENRLLQQFGSEPHPHVYTEQDLHEQVRKIVMHHNQEKGAVSLT